ETRLIGKAAIDAMLIHEAFYEADRLDAALPEEPCAFRAKVILHDIVRRVQHRIEMRGRTAGGAERDIMRLGDDALRAFFLQERSRGEACNAGADDQRVVSRLPAPAVDRLI